MVHTDESNAFSRLSVRYEHYTVNHSIEFSTDEGVNENQAESFFARARRLVWGAIHRMTPKYMLDYMNEIAWREDVRRKDTVTQMELLLDATLNNGRSRWWRGYWQGHHRPSELMFGQGAMSKPSD
ncbi:ISXO2-like transposase domain protein [compost metagenome]